MKQHTFTSSLTWEGTTANGYRGYSRDHLSVAPPATQEIPISADPTFRGNPDLLNPEQLLLMAASSCQLLAFLAVASRSRLDVRGYTDDASAVLDPGAEPARITEVVLSPVIRVAAGTDHERIREAAHTAHEECFIANTLRCPVRVEVTVVDA